MTIPSISAQKFAPPVPRRAFLTTQPLPVPRPRSHRARAFQTHAALRQGLRNLCLPPVKPFRVQCPTLQSPCRNLRSLFQKLRRSWRYERDCSPDTPASICPDKCGYKSPRASTKYNTTMLFSQCVPAKLNGLYEPANRLALPLTLVQGPTAGC